MTFGLKVIKEDAMWLSINYNKFTQDQVMENDKRDREKQIFVKTETIIFSSYKLI